MTNAQQELLKQILASKHFFNAESLKRTLQYLCDRADEPVIKEYDIAVNALGRQHSFDPKLDPIVRVNLASIRERLHAFFETEGKHESLRLDIPKGHYRVVFTEVNVQPQSRHAEEQLNIALKRFWRPYLTTSIENIIVFSEMLFLRNSAGNYIRNIYVNDLNSARNNSREFFPDINVEEYKPSFHFVSAGEMHCLVSFIRMFSEMRVNLETRNSRFSSWNSLRNSNLILIGSSRTNSFLDVLQGNSNFVITADRIENREPRDGEQEHYTGSHYLDGKLEKGKEYAVITRRPGLTPGTTVTLVTGNHGRAIEGAGYFLTTDTLVQSILESMNINSSDQLPTHFQVLLSIDLIDFDEEVVQVKYITHRVIEK